MIEHIHRTYPSFVIREVKNGVYHRKLRSHPTVSLSRKVFTDWLNEWWTTLYFVLLRPMLKWCFRLITGKCELLRITYEENNRVQRVKRIENSLEHSRCPDLKRCVTSTDYDVNQTVLKIAAIKNIIPEVHAQFQPTLADSVMRIKAYNQLLNEVEDLRKTKYSSDNVAHEAKLTELWSVYHNGSPLPDHVGPHWTDMGFQGHDPSTDFRGMGMLGLDQLIYFASTYPAIASQVLSQSHHPQYGFSFAIVSINLTEMAYTFLAKRKMRAHFYDLDKEEFSLADFHQVQCHLLYEFIQFWVAEKPKDIMEFSRIREKFRKIIRESLKTPDVRLLSSFQTEKPYNCE